MTKNKIIERFIVTFVLVHFALNYVNCSFWLIGGSLFDFKEVLGISMLLTLPFLVVIIDPDNVF